MATGTRNKPLFSRPQQPHLSRFLVLPMDSGRRLPHAVQNTSDAIVVILAKYLVDGLNNQNEAQERVAKRSRIGQ